MKKLMHFRAWAITLIALLSISTTARAANDIAIDATNFPDANFRNWLLAQAYGNDAKLTPEEIRRVVEISVKDMNIASLKGIEHFTGLWRLDCSNNQLTDINLSKNTQLRELYCSNNQLTTLYLTWNYDLKILKCQDNKLTTLDLSENNILTNVICSNNQLTTLDVSRNRNLYDLQCQNNQLTELDVSNTDMTNLYCYSNRIKSDKMQMLVNSLPTVEESGRIVIINTMDGNEQNICTKGQVEIAKAKGWKVYDNHGGEWKHYEGSDLAINDMNFPDTNFRNWLLAQTYGKDGELSNEEIAGVDYMDVSGKSITSLKGIEFFHALKMLYCYGNQLTELDVSQNIALTTLDCSNNQLTELDVSKNTAMVVLDCSSNQLTELNVSNNSALKRLSCYINSIEGNNMQRLVNTLPTVSEGEFFVIGTNYSNEKNVCTKNQVAIATDKGWKVYDYNRGSWVEYAGSEKPIDIDAANFPDANFRNWLLAQSYGQDAKLSSDEIAGVTIIFIDDKSIKSLSGIEYFTALEGLVCNNNQLSELDMSGNPALQTLVCSNNELSYIDVSKNTALTALECDNNQLTELDLSKNTALQTLTCEVNKLSELHMSQNTSLQKLSCYSNRIKDDKMQTLVNSLPTVSKKRKFTVIDTKDNNEQNVCTKAQAEIATNKGWGVYDNNGGSSTVYVGSDDVPTNIDKPTSVPSLNGTAHYSLDGKRLSGGLTQKGIYIVNGKKVVNVQ